LSQPTPENGGFAPWQRQTRVVGLCYQIEIMSEEIRMSIDKVALEKVFREVDRQTSEFLQIVSSFNEIEINSMAFEGSWTAAQVADHVRKSNNGIAQALQMKGRRGERSADQRVAELEAVFLNFDKKLSSPKFILPAQKTYDRLVLIERLERSIERIRQERGNADLAEIIDLSTLGTISKWELLHFVVFHTQRHIHQLKNIFKTIKTKTMAQINPYLNFPGTTEEAFNFYKSVFGGEFSAFMRFSDTPEGEKVPPAVKNKIMHVALPIGNGNSLMASDAPAEMGFKVNEGNNVYICINPESKAEAEKLFNSLAVGGKVNQPLQDMFWGATYGDLTDKFGIKWMINFQHSKN
jgi:PhnB protein